MKRLYAILGILLIILSGMTYLYFSNLKTATVNSDLSLKFAAQQSGLIFSMQNNKSVIDILKGQDLFNNLIGEEKVKLLDAMKTVLLSRPEFNRLISDQNIYLSILPGEKRQIDFLISMQLNSTATKEDFLQTLQSKKIQYEALQDLYKVSLSDTLSLFVGLEKNALLVSTTESQVRAALNNKAEGDAAFLDFIRKNDKLSKNSLASLYINFKKVPALLKAITPAAKSGELLMLNRQQAFAHLSYNFSKERIFFNGETKIADPNNFFTLFQDLAPEKVEADKVLPDNTANYTLYCLGSYKIWQKGLNDWFSKKKEHEGILKRKKEINAQYHLNLEGIFPANTGSQFISFQLKNKEKLVAISLTNPDKVRQLLLDLSADYAGSIKQFKEPDILYYYFGQPLEHFRRPYYAILNNYIFIANTPSALQGFLKKYEANNLLINKEGYVQIFEQLPNTASLLFYVNNGQSQDMIINNLYSSYYKQFRDPNGLKNFDSFIYQLSADQGSFQTNLFLNTRTQKTEVKSDSLQVLP